VATNASVRRYAFVWIGLVALAALSFGLSFAHLGPFGPAVALTIGAVKAVLIAAFFMHLVEQPSISRWAFATGLILVGLLLLMVSLDVLTRERTGLVQPGVESAQPLAHPLDVR
jgi:cytochrome c oxidase subunit 4